jgi:hypothetical protein
MTGKRGSDGYIGMSKQVSKGTAVQAAKFFPVTGADSWDFVQDYLEVGSLHTDEEIEDILKTGHNIDGAFDTYVKPDIGAAIMAYILGADTVVTGTVHTHTIIKANTLPWITFERDLISTERVLDAKINQVVISFEAGQPLVMSVNFFGRDLTEETAASASYETDAPFKSFEGTYTLDSSEVTTIVSGTITINRNLFKCKTLDDWKWNDFLEQKCTVDVALTLKLESADTQYLAAQLGGGAALVEALDGGSLSIDCTRGSGATEREFKIDIPTLYWVNATKHLNTDSSPVMVDVVGKAYWHTSNELITVTAKNTTATAYI